MSKKSETTFFRYCRDHNGKLVPLDVARRNKCLVPRFHPSITDPHSPQDAEESSEYQELVEEVSQNLNPVERRTWLKILDGQSIREIAKEEGVSRQAIYDRIRRMVKKNQYCAIWWRIHNKGNNL